MQNDMIIVDLAELIHNVLIRTNEECRGDKLTLELTVAALKKVFNAEIENTLKVLEQINKFSEEEKQILKNEGLYYGED